MEYVAIVIKPDAVRDVLEHVILERIFTETGYTPFFLKYWQVDPVFVPAIYPDWVYKPEFPGMAYNITQGASLLCLIKDATQQLFTRVSCSKGKMNAGGIRLSYRMHSIVEWKVLGYSGWELEKKIAENRLHSTDSTAETIALCALALNPSELNALGASEPEFVAKIKNVQMIIKRTCSI